jgi:hypothetical protein
LIVITGSRVWDDRAAIEAVMRGADGLLVGDCPTGADAIALQIAREWDIIPFVVRANWDKLGRSAGPVRNRELARAALNGRDRDEMDVSCHAFPLGESKGTRDCIRALREVGLTVFVYADPETLTAQARLF